MTERQTTAAITDTEDYPDDEGLIVLLRNEIALLRELLGAVATVPGTPLHDRIEAVLNGSKETS